MLDVDKALRDIGTFGPWHAFVYFWIFYLVFCFGLLSICIVFMEDIPEFICENPLANLTNWTFEEIRQISTPKQDVGGKFDGCKQYIRNYSQLANLNFTAAHQLFINTSSETVTCDSKKYVWHLTGMKLSIVNQWALVCDETFQVGNMATVYMVGFFLGCLTASFLADRFGRKNVIVVAGSLTSVMGIIDSYIPNLYGVLVFRAVLAFFLSVVTPTLYVLAAELCNDSFRKFIGGFYWFSYAVGYVAIAGIAYLLKDWRPMHAVASGSMLVCPILFWLMPESPRWLVSQNREKEARKILEQAARWNKRQLSLESSLELEPSFELVRHQSKVDTIIPYQGAESTNFFVIFKHWKLALRTLNIFNNWIIGAFSYYGISYLITSFSGNIFVNNAISGALEAPAYLLCYVMLMWARKNSMMVTELVAGASCLLYLAVPEDLTWAQLLVAFISKLAIAATANFVYLVTSELYPTPLRGASVGFGAMAARLGSAAAPWVVYIAQKNKGLIWIPMSIFGGASLFAGILTFFLPESQNQSLPETLEDAIYYPPQRD